jgi:uncharacterized protein YecT (DUF1311 family)
MRSGLDAAILAIRQSDFSKPVRDSFVAELKRTQAAWADYARATCTFDADATGGSAGAYVLPMCLRDMALQRAAYLDSVRRQFE